MICPKPQSSDVYYHLLQAENIRNHRFRLPLKHPQFILPGEYVYPPGYHYLLALFPKNIREEFEKLSSALFDTLLVALFLWVADETLRSLGWNTASLFLLGLSFTFSPGLVGLGIGPRAYEGTPRTLGELQTAGVFLCLWKYWSSGDWIWVMIAITIGSLLLNTSKFGGQVLLFFCLLIASLVNSTTLLIFPLLCIIGAIVVSSGNYWRILVNQVAHLHLYATQLVDLHPTTLIRKKLVWPRNTKELASYFLFNNVYGLLMIKYSVPLIVITLLADQAIFNKPSPLGLFLVAWLVSAFSIFIIVSCHVLLFLGEADRYLEHALIPAFLLFGSFIQDDYRYLVLSGFVVFHLALYVLHVSLLVHGQRKSYVNSLPELIAALKSQKPTVILSLLGNAPWELVYRADHKLFFSESMTRVYFNKEEFKRLFWRYPLPRPDMKYYIEKYQIGLIPVAKHVVETSKKKGCYYDFSGLDKVFENNDYALYQVRNSNNLMSENA
ncbi:MAG: hypothetical protein ACE5H1_01355 [Thermodesulfobacteriota bacterium]